MKKYIYWLHKSLLIKRKEKQRSKAAYRKQKGQKAAVKNETLQRRKTLNCLFLVDMQQLYIASRNFAIKSRHVVSRCEQISRCKIICCLSGMTHVKKIATFI